MFNDVARDSRTHVDSNRERKVITIFKSGKEGHSPQPTIRTEERRDKRVLNNLEKRNPFHCQTWLAKVTENSVKHPV